LEKETLILINDSQHGPGKASLAHLEYLVVHRELQNSLIKRSLSYMKYSFD